MIPVNPFKEHHNNIIMTESRRNTNMSTYMTSAILEVSIWCEENKIPEDHGLMHAIKVMNNATRALRDFNLTEDQEIYVLLAALLHDCDDRKFTPSDNYVGARRILSRILFDNHWGAKEVEIIIKMIDLVSCSKNGNDVDQSLPSWYYIPRDSDRIEALGYVGIRRAYDTTITFARRGGQQSKYWTPQTPRCTTEEELAKVATIDRIKQYKRTGFSASLIDHCYEKLLHIGQLSSGSSSLQKIANDRRQIIVDFVLEFGKTGDINWSKWLL